jgi:hypothetical protein
MAAMDNRLTAFGNQRVESHIRLRELLSSLRDGTYTGVDLRTHCLAFCSTLAKHHAAEDDDGFLLWRTTIRRYGRCWPS